MRLSKKEEERKSRLEKKKSFHKKKVDYYNRKIKEIEEKESIIGFNYKK